MKQGFLPLTDGKLNPTENREICHLCGEIPKSSLEDHFLHRHFEDLFQCCTCGNIFTSAQKLGAHVRKPCRVPSDTLNSSKFGKFLKYFYYNENICASKIYVLNLKESLPRE